MDEKFIKPIPKYIRAIIYKKDVKLYPQQKGLRMYSYLTTVRHELVKITVAVKNRYKKWYIKQVAAHGVKSDKCLVKDMEYKYFGMGYRIGWYAEGLQKLPKWFEDGKWHKADCKYYNAYTIPVNPNYIAKFPQYRYSAYQHFMGRCVIEYLKLYEKYPQTEYLLKLGLHGLYDSVTVLKRIAKDKKFCRWLIAHRDEIAKNNCYVGTVMRAYKHKKPIKQTQAVLEYKKKLERDGDLLPIKELFGKDSQSLERFFSYLEAQNTNPRRYLDYLNACNYLGLEMTLPKNRFPHNFSRWHDIRIDEYRSARALADKEERAELYKQFAAVAAKYAAMQKCKKGGYAVIIAASPAELTREGEVLHHCVGKMNYDQKMVREDTLIFFVRDSGSPDVPFVTVEYSPRYKKVLQCYGNHSGRPDEAVLDYINKVWLPFANRTIRKINKEVKAA